MSPNAPNFFFFFGFILGVWLGIGIALLAMIWWRRARRWLTLQDYEDAKEDATRRAIEMLDNG